MSSENGINRYWILDHILYLQPLQSNVYACSHICVYIYTHTHTHIYTKLSQLCPTLCDPINCSPSGSFVRGIFQARKLEWVTISFSRVSSQSRDWTQISRNCRQTLYHLSHQQSSHWVSLSELVRLTAKSWHRANLCSSFFNFKSFLDNFKPNLH